MSDVVERFRTDPVGFIRRALYKAVVGPFRYRKSDGYDAQRYWHDRFEKYGPTLKASGDEGFSEEENRRRYAEDAEIFRSVCRRERIDFKTAAVLEIGPGTGFYTAILAAEGPRSYLGADITDALLSGLAARHPGFEFVQSDITAAKPDGTFDVLLMIDVIEHIVDAKKLRSALINARDCLALGGVLILAPVMERTSKRSFYLHHWSLEDIEPLFQGYSFGELVPFREGRMLSIRRSESGAEPHGG